MSSALFNYVYTHSLCIFELTNSFRAFRGWTNILHSNRIESILYAAEKS